MNDSIYDSILAKNIITISALCVIGCVLVIVGCVLCRRVLKKHILLIISIGIITFAIVIWSILVPNMVIDIVNNSYITYEGKIEVEMYGQTAFLYINDGNDKLSTKMYNLQGDYTGTIIYAKNSKIILNMSIREENQ